MNMQRVGGVVLLLVGVALFVAGMHASDSVADRWTNFFTGHFTDHTTWFIVGGIVAGIAGLATLASGLRGGSAQA
jgi:succinate dehydrogenase hydrophobic anchor subunit